jgi:hypothetical protein
MRTPAGIECKYFYGDYFRGRNLEECRLLKASSQKWIPNLCRTCPVPSITRANACENMVLSAKVSKSASKLFKQRVQVTAFCTKTNKDVKEPHIGCGDCHPIMPGLK